MKSLAATLADLERTDPAVARGAANYDRLTDAILADHHEEDEHRQVRALVLEHVAADRRAGSPWCCTCPWCGMARREIALRAIEREEARAEG